MEEKITNLDKKLEKTDKKIEDILNLVRMISTQPEAPRPTDYTNHLQNIQHEIKGNSQMVFTIIENLKKVRSDVSQIKEERE